jgi:hypothetical protein
MRSVTGSTWGLALLLGASAALAAGGAPDDKPTPSRKRPVDLLPLAGTGGHLVKGKWVVVKKALVSAPADQGALVQIPYEPPEEYDLELTAERVKGTDSLGIVLPLGRNQPCVVLDALNATVSGINRIEGKYLDQNGTGRKGKVFPDSGTVDIRCEVRARSIGVWADGVELLKWEGNPRNLSFDPSFELPDKKTIGLGAYNSSFRVTKLVLTPVTGEGRRIK